MTAQNIYKAPDNILTYCARSYKNAIETSVSVIRGTIECTAAIGGITIQTLFEPARSFNALVKTCLGYYDFQKAKDSFRTSEITVYAEGKQKSIRRPVPERISVGLGYTFAGGAKALLTLGVVKTYITGTCKNLYAWKFGSMVPPSGSQLFVTGLHDALGAGFKLLGNTASIAAKCTSPIFQYIVTNPDFCAEMGIRSGTTLGCLYGASYGIVHASESNNVIGKINYSAITALSLASAFYTSGLNRLIGV